MADAPRGEGAAPRDAPSILPLSGIGVDGPHLVIAPPGNPRIQLDARLLDRVALVGRSPRSAIAMSAGAGLGAVAGAAGLLWGGVITALGLGLVAVDRAFESRRRVRNRELLLSLGNLDVALHVADGAAAAAATIPSMATVAGTAAPTAAAPQDEPAVDGDAAQLVDQDRQAPTVRRCEHAVERGGLAGAEPAGEDRERDRRAARGRLLSHAPPWPRRAAARRC